MKLHKIELLNFRNYENLTLDLGEKYNIFIGNNAQGKTNVLEAIYTLAFTKSFLNVKEDNLITFGKKNFKIIGTVEEQNKNKSLKLIYSLSNKQAYINDFKINKLSDYVSNLKVVVFNSDNTRMIKESPSFRRKFLNIEIGQINHNYLIILNKFNKILKQRNEYFKSVNNFDDLDINYLNIIDDYYVRLSVQIFEYRKKFIENINSKISNIYYDITGFYSLKMNYITNLDNNYDLLFNKILKNRKKDFLLRFSQIGPQRDDFNLDLNNKNIFTYGSQGQIRSSIIALKLSVVENIKEQININPILLLDDIFSELDVEKRNLIIKNLPLNVQTIITTTDLNMIEKSLLEESKIFCVKDGKIDLIKNSAR